MRENGILILGLSLIVLIAGCVAKPMIQHYPLPKGNKEVFVSETKVFKDTKFTTKGIEKMGVPADNDPYYQDLVREYMDTLKTELGRNGFTVIEKITSQSLVIKTEIGDYPPPLGGWGPFVGIIGARVKVFCNDKLILEFQEAVNTALLVPAKEQIGKFITPRIANTLAEKLR